MSNTYTLSSWNYTNINCINKSVLQDGAQKKIPIMLIGNKNDLRPECEKQGRRVVTHDDGHRLARVSS